MFCNVRVYVRACQDDTNIAVVVGVVIAFTVIAVIIAVNVYVRLHRDRRRQAKGACVLADFAQTEPKVTNRY